jgi:Recombinase/Resolvase, N terminal domain
MVRVKSCAMVYMRRSTDKQEISLPSQLDWAIAKAKQDQVQLDATVDDLLHMQDRRLHSHKAIRLDDGITGGDMTRPGFLAVSRDALSDRSISHLFIYKRDRFARPEDAMGMAQIEKRLLEAGITVVFSDSISLPYLPGEQDIARDIGLIFGYHQGGEELRKHADRVLVFQRKLAEDGFRTGGNPPFGFVRVLVDSAGKTLEKLPPGKTVNQPGCHVRVVPDDAAKIAVWVEILVLKEQGWGLKRIASHLNDRGIPSPDAGRTRTDQGVRHRVSGKWSPNTIGELCRNPIILGVQRYGKRSEGRIRRLGAAGPRLLDEQDRGNSGAPKIIFNDPSLLVERQVGEVKADAEKWEAVQAQMDERGKQQRGVPRAKDPSRYPLACRLIDMTDGCGSILYARTNQKRPVYTCGRYMRTTGAECRSNQVDAEAMLRFVLKTLKQLVDRHGNREKLRQKLQERASQLADHPGSDPRVTELAYLKSRQVELLEQKTTIEYRMARERDDTIYEVLKGQHGIVQSELQSVARDLQRVEAEQASTRIRKPEDQVESALGLLDDVTRITSDAQARSEVNPLLRRLGIRLGLNFHGVIKGKKREVRRLVSGVMAFGDAPLPVLMHGKDNVEGDPQGCACESQPELAEEECIQGKHDSSCEGARTAPAASDEAVSEGGRDETRTAGTGLVPVPAVAGDRTPVRPSESQPEGISTTKVSRGKRIRTSDLTVPKRAGTAPAEMPESLWQ